MWSASVTWIASSFLITICLCQRSLQYCHFRTTLCSFTKFYKSLDQAHLLCSTFTSSASSIFCSNNSSPIISLNILNPIFTPVQRILKISSYYERKGEKRSFIKNRLITYRNCPLWRQSSVSWLFHSAISRSFSSLKEWSPCFFKKLVMLWSKNKAIILTQLTAR